MGERAGVLGELRGAQPANVGDALDRRRALVGGELLVAKDGQPFLQAELEQSRQVMRLPVQLWKYSWAMTPSMPA